MPSRPVHAAEEAPVRQVSNFALRLPTDLYETLRAEAAATGTSINGIIVDLVATHVNANRSELIDLIGQAAQTRYRAVLDKLADL